MRPQSSLLLRFARQFWGRLHRVGLRRDMHSISNMQGRRGFAQAHTVWSGVGGVWGGGLGGGWFRSGIALS